jgi:hypothetical protein
LIRRFIFFGFTPLLLAAAIGLYAVGWALSRPIQRTIGAPPSSLEAEAVTFSSESGSAIHGWLSRGLLVAAQYCCCRASVPIGFRWYAGEFLRQAGYSTLLIDFQATGESEGEKITFGWRERFDVLAAVNSEGTVP